ncbi:protein VAC14 homolog isoform X2 [Dermacentor andersoni]|uniref:protein VAC14 homolog isoform X2 n=1 Tax=Dermacentor andersoni TaxID=34620 RepID=UPI002415CD03|nr:protein VAC14 homolog isoform X2 [Dermacentor andersoni]
MRTPPTRHQEQPPRWMVKDFMSKDNVMQIRKLLKLLGQDFTLAHNPNSRKGGLIGLAAMAIALGKDSALYVDELVKPILACLSDSESRVRYYACEALYNVVKVARGAVLPNFNDIFDCLSKLAADSDQNVKNGSELLDRLLKDIVTESSSFDLVAFMPLLRERVYTKNHFARAFVVSWVSVMNSVPDIDMLIFLPEILDGLFHILEDPSVELKKMCETTLSEFLRNIVKHPDRVDFAAMIRNLIVHSHSSEELVQYTAISWMREFVALSGRTLLPHAAGILEAILPTLSYDDPRRPESPSHAHAADIRETAKAVNTRLMQLVTEEDDQPSHSPAASESDSPTSRRLGAHQRIAGDLQQDGVTVTAMPVVTELELTPLVNVLTRQLMHVSMQTRIAVLRWFLHLFTKIPNKIFVHVEEIFPKLLQTLSDPSDEVVLLDLEVLAEISSSSAAGGSGATKRAASSGGGVGVPAGDAIAVPNSYFGKFMLSLLDLFQSDLQLLEERGSFIIRQLCVLLSAEDIYQSLSEILLGREDLRFAAHMVQTLNTILLTSTELFELRNQLKDLNTKESCSLFCCLYRSWCHNPVATISLCLLTQNYEHTCSLLHLFSDMEVTVEFLTEIDKLVQLIESPIFTYLRLQLLDSPQQSYLVKSLYGLLMLLPQSEAFHTLRTRLACLPHPSLQQMDTGTTIRKTVESSTAERCKSEIDFQELLDHFQKVQESHKKAKPAARLNQVLRLSGVVNSGHQA